MLLDSNVTGKARSTDNESTLGQNEESFRTLADNMSQLAWMADSSGALFWYNQRWIDYTGHTMESMLGSGWHAVHDPAHIQRVVEKYAHHIATGTTWEDTFPLRRADGLYRWFLSRAIPIRDAQGEVTRWFGTNTDITEQREIALALEASEARLRLLDAIGQATRNAIDPAEIMASSLCLLGEYLGVARCAYADVDAANDSVTIREDWTAPDVTSSAGTYRLSLFGDTAITRLKRGQTLTFADVDAALKDGGAAMFKGIGIRAMICASLVTRSKLRGMLAIHSATPRAWSEAEVSLVEAVAERSWAHIERVHAEAVLRDSQAQMSNLLATVPCLIWAADAQGETVYLSQWFLKLIGRPIDKMMMRHWPEFVHPDDMPGVAEHWSRCLATAVPYQRTFRMLQASGVYRWHALRSDPVLDPQGRVLSWCGSGADVDEQMQTAAALADSEARFRGMVDNMTQLAWVADGGGEMIWFSRRLLDYIGATPEDLRAWQFVHHPDHVERVVEKFSRCIAQGIVYDDTFPMRGADGSYRWFLTRMTPARDAQGRIVRWFGTNTDITEQREVAIALEASEARLREADRQKDEFLATLAHELRNPLSPIKNVLEVLERKPERDTLDRCMPVMKRQVNHLVRLVDDLLEVSRITQNKIELKRAVVDLASILKSAIESAQPRLEAARHRFVVELPDESVQVDADAVRLSQVFINLLNNAAKYTPEGGNIWLRARRSGDRVIVTVTDSGIGIPKEMLPQVFGMFAQVDRSLRGAQDGLGVGLAIVKRLLEMHGGSVEATSPGEGLGSSFIVNLPIAKSAVSAPATVVHPAMTAVFPTPILVVDDNRDAADSLGALLNLLGSESHVAHNGEAALRILEQVRPVVALLDLGMPDMNGFELARRIRAHPNGASMRLIALTGWGQTEDRRRTREAGFDAHLLKPVNIDSLKEMLAAGVYRS